MKLDDDYRYPIKGVGEASYRLDSEKPLKMKDILYVPGLKKNLISISALFEKGFRVVSLMVKSLCGQEENLLMML